MTCFPDEVNWNNKEFTKEMLDYLRAVYCVHPMVLDALDYINSLESRIAELEEQVWNLNLENERLEEAYWIDETISPDGTLKPSVRKLLERLEKAETDLRLSDDLVKALDNHIAELERDFDTLFRSSANKQPRKNTQTLTFEYGMERER